MIGTRKRERKDKVAFFIHPLSWGEKENEVNILWYVGKANNFVFRKQKKDAS